MQLKTIVQQRIYLCAAICKANLLFEFNVKQNISFIYLSWKPTQANIHQKYGACCQSTLLLFSIRKGCPKSFVQDLVLNGGQHPPHEFRTFRQILAALASLLLSTKLQSKGSQLLKITQNVISPHE